MEIIKNKRILAAIGIISLFLGIILPYYTFSAFGFSESISLWGYLEGKIILALTLANALFVFKDIIEKYVPQLFNSIIGKKIANVKNPKLSLIPLVLIIIFVIYLNSKMSGYVHFDKGIGFYLLWIGIIALAAHSFIYKGNNENNVNNTNNIYGQPTQLQQPIQNNTIPPEQNNINNSNNVYGQSIQFQQPIQNKVQTPQGNVKYCPNCGTAVDINASNCPNCMFKF